MNTLYLDALGTDSGSNIRTAASILRSGGIVAFPTETVYGLGADTFNESAVAKIFAAKGRPQDNPLISHITDIADIHRLARDIPPSAFLLAESFWPGPLTLVLKRNPDVPPIISAGLDTVSVRIPSHHVARRLIELSGTAVAAPSANISGRPSATTALHVQEDFNGKIDAIVSGGDCEVGVESTVLSLCGDIPRLLRPGGVPLESLRAVLGEVAVDRAVYEIIGEGERVSSPGMKYRHYAPRADVTVVCGAPRQTAEYIKSEANETTGIICFDEFEKMFYNREVYTIGPAEDSAANARALFGALRSFDRSSVEKILAQCPDDRGVGLAVANRLKKAAGFKIVVV